MLLLPLGLSASAADGDFAGGAKPWFIMPWWLKVQYALKSWPQMGFREDSMLILHEGRLVYEKYAKGQGADVPHAGFSVTKSVVSALTGIAVKDGLIDVRDKVRKYYPTANIAGQDSKLDMTIEHLLTMRSGLPDTRDCFKAPDAGLAAFETPQKKTPGGTFAFTYNSGAGPQCLVGILERATGQNLRAFAEERLFGPLGITGVTWETTDYGSPTGGSGISMTSRDMLRLGQLYLGDGVWNGERILPAGWVKSTQPKFNTILSYGYLFWGNGWGPLMGGSYEARGYFGQFITVYPDKNIVIVRTGSGLS
jgi:CubicO group peptidase (beta-lactamase class C family)